LKSIFPSQDNSADILLRDTLLIDTSWTKVSPASQNVEINAVSWWSGLTLLSIYCNLLLN
jgi:hypothetical protein